MKKLVFLVSGQGGNLRFIHEVINLNYLPQLALSLVIADRQCGALESAQRLNIKSCLINYTKERNEELLSHLKKENPDYVITNIHKILDEQLVKLFEGKLINLHYSLLPAFKGLIGKAAIESATKMGCKFLGTTVHFVEKEVDAGRIIGQSVIPINDDCRGDLVEQIFQSGCINLANSLLKLLAVPPFLLKTNILFSPYYFCQEDFSQDFWNRIKYTN